MLPRVLLLHFKLASFQAELRQGTSCTTLYLEVANFVPELQERASRTTFYVNGAVVQQEQQEAGVHFACYFCAYNLRISSWSCASCATFVLKHCDAYYF